MRLEEERRKVPKPSAALLLKQFPFPPLMDPKTTRHDDLKGDAPLIYCLKPGDPNYTSYGGNFGGKQIDEAVKAKQLDTHTISVMQMACPDPVVMSKFSFKL